MSQVDYLEADLVYKIWLPVLQIRDFQLVGQWAEEHFEPLGGPWKMHIFTSKKH